MLDDKEVNYKEEDDKEEDNEEEECNKERSIQRGKNPNRARWTGTNR